MTLFVTPIVAGLLTALYIFLSFRVIAFRRNEKTTLGDRGNAALLRRIRVHSNFAEYTPLALVLLLVMELQGAAVWLLAALGLLLIAGRCLHAYGVAQDPEPLKLRIAGMALTFGFLGLSACAVILLALGPL